MLPTLVLLAIGLLLKTFSPSVRMARARISQTAQHMPAGTYGTRFVCANEEHDRKTPENEVGLPR